MHRFQRIPDWTPGYMNVAPQHLDIMAECTACGEGREFSKDALPPGLRHALVSEVEERLKCSSCGAKAAKLRFGYFIEREKE